MVVGPLLMYPVELLHPGLSTSTPFCLTRIGMTFLSFSASSLTLVHISVDRFMAIVYPLKHLVNSKRKSLYYTILVFIWIMSIGTGSSVIWLNNIHSNNTLPCTNSAILSYHLNVLITCIVFLLLLINSVLYVAIATEISRKRPVNRINVSRVSRTQLMMVVYAGFVVCWLPLGVVGLIIIANQTKRIELFCTREYLIVIAFTNSGVNWIIYGLANKSFRDSFRTILRCTCASPFPGLSASSGSSYMIEQCQFVESSNKS